MTKDLRRILSEHSSVAVVGLSTDPAKAAHAIPAFLKSAGWRVVPVHPRAAEILGEPAYRSLEDIPEPVDVVEVFRPAAEAPALARQAVSAGARVLWLQQGITSPEARRIAVEGGVEFVENQCMGRLSAMYGIRHDGEPT